METSSDSSSGTAPEEAFESPPTTRNSSFTSAGGSVTPNATNKSAGILESETIKSVNQILSGSIAKDDMPKQLDPSTIVAVDSEAGDTVTSNLANEISNSTEQVETQDADQLGDPDTSQNINEEPSESLGPDNDISVAEEDNGMGASYPYDARGTGNDKHAYQAASYLQAIEQRLQFLEARLQQFEWTGPPNLYPIPDLSSNIADPPSFSPPPPPPPPPAPAPPEPPVVPSVDLPGADAKDEHYNTNHDRPFDLEDQIVKVSPEKWKESRSARAIPANSTLIVESKELDPIALSLRAAISGVEHSEGAGSGSDTASNLMSQIPDRIAIGSCALIHDIGQMTDLKMAHIPNVFLKPFKIFVSHEKTIRERAEKENLKLQKLIAEAKEQAKLLEATDKVDTAEKESGEVHVEQHISIPEEGETTTTDEKWEETVDIKFSQALTNDYKCLIHLLDTELKPILDLRQEIEDTTLKYSAFEDLWHLFKPGDLVVSKNPKIRAYRVMHVTGGRPLLSPNWKPSTSASLDYSVHDPLTRYGSITPIVLDCFYIDFDGKVFGPAPQRIEIEPFEGKRSITSLDVYPMRFDQDQDGLTEMLVKRGSRFVELSQVTHKRYTGLSVKEVETFERTEELDSDVIIDFTLALQWLRQEFETIRLGPDYGQIRVGPQINDGIINEPTRADRRETFELVQCTVAGCNVCTDNHDDSLFDLKLRSDFMVKTDLLHSIEVGKNRLDQLLSDRDRLMLLPVRVYGYVLLSRKFYPLDIDLVKDIDDEDRGTNLDGFRDLVIDKDHKRIVKALVKTHTRGPRATISTEDNGEARLPERQLDLVRGKGRGLIILLHGVPGVGKTSTAECVAASTKRPLFPITCGDIGGDSARQVEDNLERYFELARKWGCVLLLDEADVFLARRRRGDIKQNSLVSVFLRVLEYYSGILILTTNRVGEFDEAIKSRIHVSLYYRELDRTSTSKIWRMHLNRLSRENKKPAPARRIEFDTEEIMDFARDHWEDGHRWNGRQIKNAFQTAIALAEWDASDSPDTGSNDIAHLETKHFKDVAIASARFDQYLLKVRDERTEQMQAREMGIRRDDWNDREVPTASGVTFPKTKATRRRQEEDVQSDDNYDE